MNISKYIIASLLLAALAAGCGDENPGHTDGGSTDLNTIDEGLEDGGREASLDLPSLPPDFGDEIITMDIPTQDLPVDGVEIPPDSPLAPEDAMIADDGVQSDAASDSNPPEDADIVDSGPQIDAVMIDLGSQDDILVTGDSSPSDDALGASDSSPQDDLTQEDVPQPMDSQPDARPPWPEVYLNEIDCHNRDWIEVVNRSDSLVDISGWILTDSLEEADRFYTFGEGTYLDAQPNGRMVIARQDENEDGITFGISCGNDTIWLLRPDGSTADEVSLPEVLDSFTWGRIPDIFGEWEVNQPTKNDVNLPFADQTGSLYDPFTVVEIDLGLPVASEQALRQDSSTYVDGTFQLTWPDGTQSELMDVGIRLKGGFGSFESLDGKAAFKIKFDYDSGADRFLGLKRMTLNNMTQDRSMIHEMLSYRILGHLSPLTPRIGYAFIRLNGEIYGLYANLETYDEIFLQQHYSSTQHLYESDYGSDLVPNSIMSYEIDVGDEDDRSDLQTLVAVANDTPDPGWSQAMASVADLDQMRRKWAVELFTGNFDGYVDFKNNYYLHSNGEGVFTMLTSGTDGSFTSYKRYHQGSSVLFARCMTDQECLYEYDLILAELLCLREAMDLDAFALELSTFIAPWVAEDTRKPYSDSAVADNVENARSFIANRWTGLEELVACLSDPNPDTDGDGYSCDMDCNEEDPGANAGATEICQDGIDQNCDGRTDERPCIQAP